MGVKSRTKRERARPARPVCVFCGGSPITWEDVWPRWIGEYLGKAEVTIEARNRQSMDEPHRLLYKKVKLSFSAKRRRVCAPCNNEWMSELENAVSPLLKMMFDEKIALVLSAAQQRTLATWTFKTALMLQFVIPKRIIPIEVYREFFIEREPVLCVISVARHGQPHVAPGIAHGVGWHLGDPPIPPERPNVDTALKAYGFTFNANNVAFQIVGAWATAPKVRVLPPMPPESVAPYVQFLWPILASNPDPSWPPDGRPSFTANGLLDFCFSMREARQIGTSTLWTPGMP